MHPGLVLSEMLVIAFTNTCSYLKLRSDLSSPIMLQGGVGYLARKDKLTIDSITAVELAVPSGEVRRASFGLFAS